MTVTLMAQQVVTTWLSDAVVPGEQTRLFIILTDGDVYKRQPLKPEHGLFGRHKPYGTKSARNILRIRIFCATFGTSDPL